jgi:hypothetical protein
MVKGFIVVVVVVMWYLIWMVIDTVITVKIVNSNSIYIEKSYYMIDTLKELKELSVEFNF